MRMITVRLRVLGWLGILATVAAGVSWEMAATSA